MLFDQHLPISSIPSPWQPPFYFFVSMSLTFLDSTHKRQYNIICFSLSGSFNSVSWIYRFICLAKFESFQSFSLSILPLYLLPSGILITKILDFFVIVPRYLRYYSFFSPSIFSVPFSLYHLPVYWSFPLPPLSCYNPIHQVFYFGYYIFWF